MRLSTSASLAVLRAVGEPTRLRISVLLERGALSVTDLTEVLGQSQPRISRHLKLLTDAGVVQRSREGNRVYFSFAHSGPIANLANCLVAAVDPDDPEIATDLRRLDDVRAQRAAAAHEYFSEVAPDWDRVRSLHAPDRLVEQAVMSALADRPITSLLDVGTGTGRMLQLLAGQTERAVGLDSSHSMLAVARANLEAAGLATVELRQGDIQAPPSEPAGFDVVIIHQVLHFLDDPDRAVASAARLVAPGGRLLIVDFAPHLETFLQDEHAHRRLGFQADAVASWLSDSGLTVDTIKHIGPDDDGRLTVSIWVSSAAPDGDHSQPSIQPQRSTTVHEVSA